MTDAVRDNTDRHRFELDSGGHMAFANYRLSSGVITLTHTEVPPALRGGGIGSKLVRGALDIARARGLRVVAQCPFVADVIRRHPEYADLV
jgi:hypothetical protein